MEKLKRLTDSLQAWIRNENEALRPPRPTGIIAAMREIAKNPERTLIIYAGGSKIIREGKEVVVFDSVEVFTDQVTEQNVLIGDVVVVDHLTHSIEHLGTPEDVLEQTGVDIIEQVGWNPKTDPIQFVD